LEITMRRRHLLLLSALALPSPMLLAGCATTPPPAAIGEESTITVTAVVESVDQTKRAVLLRGPRGGLHTVFVSDEVRNLPQVKAGDRVRITYREAWAADIVPAGTPMTSGMAVGAARTPQGSTPGGVVAGELRTRVRIQSVDTASNTVTFTRPDGFVRQVTVRRPMGQQFIRGLRPGDEVEIAYTEALAISVQPMN